jgi:hypothetical protein
MPPRNSSTTWAVRIHETLPMPYRGNVMTLRRDRRRGQKKYNKQSRFQVLSICSNCGEPGPHFAPPSFGDPGFYLCERKTS